jgi:NADH dehydrogenase
VRAEHLSCGIEDLAKKKGCRFVRDSVTFVDLKNKEVTIPTQKIGYDYLIIAAGSETNFYGREDIKRYAYKLDDAEDAKRIAGAVRQGSFDTFLVCGGGYTGVEVATNLKLYLLNNGINKDVIIVERANSLLGPLPQWMKDYTASNLARLGIKVSVNATVDKIEGEMATLSSGEAFSKAMLIWAAGVKTDDFVQRVDTEKTTQGRLKADAYLRIDEHCFAIGDAADFAYKGNKLRMAVQFAVYEGRCAAANIINLIKGRPLKRYVPVDLGYVIPMANNRSCGIVMGIRVRGMLATALHYLMCIYRSVSFKNKWGILLDLVKRS